MGDEWSQSKCSLATEFLRKGWPGPQGFKEHTPLAIGQGSLRWEAHSLGTFEEGCVCPGKAGGWGGVGGVVVTMATRYPGKEGPWFRGTSVMGKGDLHSCETPSCETPSCSLLSFFQAMPKTPPRLVFPPFWEMETSWPVNCSLNGLFPASEAHIQLALGNQMLNATVVSQADTLTASATAKIEQEGTQEIVCNVTLGVENRETREKLVAYSKRGRSQNCSGG